MIFKKFKMFFAFTIICLMVSMLFSCGNVIWHDKDENSDTETEESQAQDDLKKEIIDNLINEIDEIIKEAEATDFEKGISKEFAKTLYDMTDELREKIDGIDSDPTLTVEEKIEKKYELIRQTKKQIEELITEELARPQEPLGKAHTAILVSNYIKLRDDGSVDESSMTYISHILRVVGFDVKMYTPDLYNKANLKADSKIEGYDLYVYDGFIPNEFPTDGAIWIFNPTTSSALNSLGISVSDTITKDQSNAKHLGNAVANGTSSIFDDITKNVNAQDIFVTEYRTFSYNAGSDYTPIFSADGMPVVIVGNNGTQRIVAIGFDLVNSNWPVMLKDFAMFFSIIADYSLSSEQ